MSNQQEYDSALPAAAIMPSQPDRLKSVLRDFQCKAPRLSPYYIDLTTQQNSSMRAWLQEELGINPLNAAPHTIEDAGYGLTDIFVQTKEELRARIQTLQKPDILFVSVLSPIKKTYIHEAFESLGYRLLTESGPVIVFWKRRKVSSTRHEKMLSDPEIQTTLDPSARYLRELPDTTPAKSETAQPSSVLTTKRFDIAIKSLYGRLYLNKRAESWRTELYKEHALRITGPGEVIAEYDGSRKAGLSGFLNSFHNLLNCNLSSSDIPAVPVDRNSVAFDGSHRIAAAIACQRDIKTVHLDAEAHNLADASFFLSAKNGHPPIMREYIDASAIEYCRAKTGLGIALLFPALVDKRKAELHINKLANIVYKKDIVFTPIMGRPFLHQVYYGHEWMNDETNSAGFSYKIQSCFPHTGILSAYLLDDFDFSLVRGTKDVIRRESGIGHHAVHITDSDEETLRLARALFNENSLDFLRMGASPSLEFLDMMAMLEGYIFRNDLDPDNIAIGGSGLLGLLGLREPKDIDIITDKPETIKGDLPVKIGSHDSLYSLYPSDFGTILGDPTLHGWYMGLKFCSPQVIIDMKLRRGESKDLNDVSKLSPLIPRRTNRFLKKNLTSMIVSTNMLMFRSKGVIKRLLRPSVRYLRRLMQKG